MTITVGFWTITIFKESVWIRNTVTNEGMETTKEKFSKIIDDFVREEF